MLYAVEVTAVAINLGILVRFNHRSYTIMVSECDRISRTDLNRTLPLIISSYASFAHSRGKVSFIDRTSESALKASVS
jgi:thiamine phosphate synthase YjbQ (UPF0047 family)